MDLEIVYDKIYRYIFFRFRNRELAEDITQETFVRYIDARGSLNHPNLRYLYTIARNLCVDEYRKIQEISIPDGYEKSSGNLEDDIVNGIDIRNALLKMDVDDQELILLRYVNEESVSIISELYGCSRFAMYRRLNRIERKLQRILEGNDDE